MNIESELRAILPLIEKYSPELAKLIPPPFGTLISYALEIAFGAEHGNLSDLTNKIQTDPNSESKIKKLEASHAQLISQVSLSDYQANLKDNQNAREKDLEETKITGKRDIIIDYISLIVVVGFFLMGVAIAVTKFDASDHDILYMLIGQASFAFLAVIGHHFGSSYLKRGK